MHHVPLAACADFAILEQITDAASELENKHKIRVPFPEPRPPKDSNYKVSFSQPAQFNVVGSYVGKTMIKTQKHHRVDMVVVMPAEMFQEKDYLDMRYFYKRAYYLAVIAARLKKDFDGVAELSFEYLGGNSLLPIVSLQPAADEKNEGSASSLDYQLRIIPCLADNVFPKSKLHLGTSLVRKGQSEDSTTAARPTQFYNSTLAAEGCFLPYLRLLRSVEKKCSSFKNACILGRVWLQQRGFGSDISAGGFGHFEWALLLALLLQGGDGKGTTLSSSLSSTQLFKATIQFLSVTNFAEKPCVLGSGKLDLDNAAKAGPVLFDSKQELNVAFKMSPWSAALLYQHAKWTRNLLNDNSTDQFNPCFILKSDVPFENFDLIARIDCGSVKGDSIDLEFRGKTWAFGHKVHRVLKRALADKELGERARLIHVQTPSTPSWPLNRASASIGESFVEVRVLFDSVNMSRGVDRGPSAGPTAEEKAECDKFRGFWGEKAELRRFERDTIRETLVWSSSTPFSLCEEITRYILGLHLGVGQADKEIKFYGNGFSALVPLKSTDLGIFNATKKEFGVFERDVRELEDLPLHVRQIAPISPELRHASLKMPLSGTVKSGPQPMDVIISFEASGKWPENIIAIQRTKVAFLLMIGDLLEKSKPGYIRTHLGLEDAQFETEILAFLDVIYETGASFRLRIQSDLEETLLERQVKDKTLEQHLRQRATALLSTFKRMYTTLPLHNQAISTFVTRFPALSPTIRLLKYWFSSHKLSVHFTEDFIELVALHVFLTPYPWDAPSSASAGFLRTLLFLSHWDWRSEPLILDTSGEMTPADRSAIETRFQAWRKIDPGMGHTVLFAATATDGTGIAHTTVDGEAKPSKVVAARMTALAKSALGVARQDSIALDPRRLFVPSLKEYDAVIHLNRKTIKNILRTYPTDNLAELEEDKNAHRSKFKNLDGRTGQDALPLVQHPADVFLKKLTSTYAGPLVFFRGAAADDMAIGAIWNPQMQKRAFKVNLPASYKPAPATEEEGSDMDEDNDEGKGAMVEINREAILAEIARIGGDLVERIDTN